MYSASGQRRIVVRRFGTSGCSMTRDSGIFSHQLAHLLWLAVLLTGVWAASHLSGFYDGQLFGFSTITWVYASVGVAIVHQAFVWACWRTELYSQALTSRLGKSAFNLYATIFSILILSRPVLMTGLAISNVGTLPLNPYFAVGLSLLLAIPVVYLGYSVKRFFGFRRAFGIDHFEPSYRDLPRVRDGIFRFSGNAMYVYGFLLLWIPGLLFRSTAAIVIALFSHLYIWVHYFVTEKPDMEVIYGPAAR
jgi:hypothetical protein